MIGNENKKYYKELLMYKEIIEYIKNERNSYFAHDTNNLENFIGESK